MRSWSFAKGHGTGNDFVLIEDRHNLLDPSDDDVRLLCDRRFGIGGDGLLRAIKAEHMAEWEGDPNLWFMDYRNADGSVAEMCGNGLRVFARFLSEEGLATGRTLSMATRAGLKEVALLPDQLIRADLGTVDADHDPVRIRLGERTWPGRWIDVGNPHVVVWVDDPDTLAGLDLGRGPSWEPIETFPDGVNVEFVLRLAPGHLRMRVHERGAGETQSCGTGTVAAATAAALSVAPDAVPEGRWQVDVPGGSVQVDLVDGRAHLTGPAVVVARGEVLLPDKPVD